MYRTFTTLPKSNKLKWISRIGGVSLCKHAASHKLFDEHRMEFF